MNERTRVARASLAALSGVTASAAGFSHTVALVVGSIITATSDGNNLTLFWPDTAAGYRVESALSLFPPVAWSAVTGRFATHGGTISLVPPMTGSQKFHRLTRP